MKATAASVTIKRPNPIHPPHLAATMNLQRQDCQLLAKAAAMSFHVSAIIWTVAARKRTALGSGFARVIGPPR